MRSARPDRGRLRSIAGRAPRGSGRGDAGRGHLDRGSDVRATSAASRAPTSTISGEIESDDTGAVSSPSGRARPARGGRALPRACRWRWAAYRAAGRGVRRAVRCHGVLSRCLLKLVLASTRWSRRSSGCSAAWPPSRVPALLNTGRPIASARLNGSCVIASCQECDRAPRPGRAAAFGGRAAPEAIVRGGHTRVEADPDDGHRDHPGALPLPRA